MNPTLKAIKLLMLIMTLAIFGGIALAGFFTSLVPALRETG